MTLKQKREIVRRFRTGENLAEIPFSMNANFRDWTVLQLELERVLRDFMNGKFTLNVKPREQG